VKLELSKPIIYLITRGATDDATTAESPEFQHILLQVSAAVAAGVPLIQLREKKLTTRVLFELTERAVRLTHKTATRILVNDRADVARAAGADGVHLTTRSIDVATIRKTFGKEFLIGASTHSLAEACAARAAGADFIVLGPIFPTTSKEKYGSALGLNSLRDVARELTHFPVLALGGIGVKNARDCLRAGASGIAGISLFNEPERMQSIAAAIRPFAKGVTK